MREVASRAARHIKMNRLRQSWWPIESVFSDFKTRGFNLEQSHLVYADRLARWIRILSLALHWAARSGRDDALKHPLPG